MPQFSHLGMVVSCQTEWGIWVPESHGFFSPHCGWCNLNRENDNYRIHRLDFRIPCTKLRPRPREYEFLESATFSFRIRLSSTRIRLNTPANPERFESAIESGTIWIRNESDTACNRVDGRIRKLSNTMNYCRVILSLDNTLDCKMFSFLCR